MGSSRGQSRRRCRRLPKDGALGEILCVIIPSAERDDHGVPGSLDVDRGDAEVDEDAVYDGAARLPQHVARVTDMDFSTRCSDRVLQKSTCLLLPFSDMFLAHATSSCAR